MPERGPRQEAHHRGAHQGTALHPRQLQRLVCVRAEPEAAGGVLLQPASQDQEEHSLRLQDQGSGRGDSQQKKQREIITGKNFIIHTHLCCPKY